MYLYVTDIMLAMTGGRSVPRVFINGEFIGGGDDTVSKAASGELVKLYNA
jgi:glutaredoxin 3